MLIINDKRTNRKIASGRIVVENFFGRLCSLWAVIASKFRCDESNYDLILNIFVALQNIHIKCNPLREDDVNVFERLKKRLYTIGDQIVTKINRVQADYRARRRAGMTLSFGYTADEDEGAGAMLDLFDS